MMALIKVCLDLYGSRKNFEISLCCDCFNLGYNAGNDDTPSTSNQNLHGHEGNRAQIWNCINRRGKCDTFTYFIVILTVNLN